MYDARRIIGTTGRAVAILLVAMSLATVLSCAAFAAEQAAVASPKVHELATLLAVELLKEQGMAKSTAGSPAQQTSNSLQDYANSSPDVIRDQVVALARAIPDLPNQPSNASPRSTPTRAGAKFSSTLASSGTPIMSRPDVSRPRPPLSSTSPSSGRSVSALNGCSGR